MALLDFDERRDFAGVLLLTEGLHKLRSACSAAIVHGNSKVLEVANEVLEGLANKVIYSLQLDEIEPMKIDMNPNGPVHYVRPQQSQTNVREDKRQNYKNTF